MEHVMHIFGTADGDLQLASLWHITWTKLWPEPKAWAGLGFWQPKAQAWISSSPAQAELGQAKPAQHYVYGAACSLIQQQTAYVIKSVLW